MAFTKNSDPISDMGIGIEAEITKEYQEWRNFHFGSDSSFANSKPLLKENIFIWSAVFLGNEEYVKYLLNKYEFLLSTLERTEFHSANNGKKTISNMIKNKIYELSGK